MSYEERDHGKFARRTVTNKGARGAAGSRSFSPSTFTSFAFGEVPYAFTTFTSLFDAIPGYLFFGASTFFEAYSNTSRRRDL